MDTALNLNCNLSGMYTYSPALKFKFALSHQPSHKSRHEVYEIFGLAVDVFAAAQKFYRENSVFTCRNIFLKYLASSFIGCATLLGGSFF